MTFLQELNCFFISQAHQSLNLTQIGIVSSGSVEEKTATEIIKHWENQSDFKPSKMPRKQKATSGSIKTNKTKNGKVETKKFSLNSLPSDFASQF